MTNHLLWWIFLHERYLIPKIFKNKCIYAPSGMEVSSMTDTTPWFCANKSSKCQCFRSHNWLKNKLCQIRSKICLAKCPVSHGGQKQHSIRILLGNFSFFQQCEVQGLFSQEVHSAFSVHSSVVYFSSATSCFEPVHGFVLFGVLWQYIPQCNC